MISAIVASFSAPYVPLCGDGSRSHGMAPIVPATYDAAERRALRDAELEIEFRRVWEHIFGGEPRVRRHPPPSTREAGPARHAMRHVATGPGAVRSPSGAGIVVDAASKSFRHGRSRPNLVLDSVSLEVKVGELVAVLGPSGCGKSTLLNLCAGLLAPDLGSISLHGEPPAALIRRHEIGIAFQDDALLPWLSAEKNIALPWKLAGRRVDRQRVDALLSAMQLGHAPSLRPSALSGGMRQRVALARSVALRPKVLLLDEPLASLDAVTRRTLQTYLEELVLQLKSTATLLVTHSVSEAVRLADRVVLLSDRPGRVVQVTNIHLPRPRRREIITSRDFHELCDAIISRLEDTATS